MVREGFVVLFGAELDVRQHGESASSLGVAARKLPLNRPALLGRIPRAVELPESTCRSRDRRQSTRDTDRLFSVGPLLDRDRPLEALEGTTVVTGVSCKQAE